MESLKYVYELGFKLNENTMMNAVHNDDIDCVIYLYNNNCPIPEDIYSHLKFCKTTNIINYLLEKKIKINGNPIECISKCSYNFDIIKILYQKCGKWNRNICENIVKKKKRILGFQDVIKKIQSPCAYVHIF